MEGSTNPLIRYHWLGQRYTFGGEYTFSVYDKISGDSYGCSGHYVETLEVYPVAAAEVVEKQLLEWILSALKKYSLTDCLVLNKDGKEIGRWDIYSGRWTKCPEVFTEIKFFVLEETHRKTKVVVHEVV